MSAISSRPHVVIIGGGFAGLQAAKQLRKANVDVTLIDRANHHTFQPLLYQVATAGLSPSDIAMPIRSILRAQSNTEVFMDEVQSIDPNAKQVQLQGDRTVTYDALLLATGARHSYFGNESWSRNAPGLKTIEEATEIRRRILLAFEAAERSANDMHARQANLTFVIVGAGPTGVELAGAIAEMARHSLASDFRHFNPNESKVLLIEAGTRVLASFSEELSHKAAASLAKLGVQVLTNTRVTDIGENHVVAGGVRIATHTILWAAGVVASPLAHSLGCALDSAGRVLVEPDLSLPGHPEVFVAGDLAFVAQANGDAVPGVAPAAMQEGRHAALNIVRLLKGLATEPFVYVDKGNLATIGRAQAVAEFKSLRISGFVAWLMWLGVHVFFLIGFRNRLFVLLQWAWAYVTFQRSSRLITYPRESGSLKRSEASE